MGDRVRVQCRTFISVCNQPGTQANSAVRLSGVGKWVPASAGKAKAGMVHSVSGWTWGVQVKLWDPLRTRAVPERLRGVFTTRRYTNSPLPYLLRFAKASNRFIYCNLSVISGLRTGLKLTMASALDSMLSSLEVKGKVCPQSWSSF